MYYVEPLEMDQILSLLYSAKGSSFLFQESTMSSPSSLILNIGVFSVDIGVLSLGDYLYFFFKIFAQFYASVLLLLIYCGVFYYYSKCFWMKSLNCFPFRLLPASQVGIRPSTTVLVYIFTLEFHGT